jgi:hypothetical protein
MKWSATAASWLYHCPDNGRLRKARGCLSLLAVAGRHAKVVFEMRTVEAILQRSGEVRLVEPMHVRSPRRALVTILEEDPQVHDTALLSEPTLAEDWNCPEEDATWAHLQPGKSSSFTFPFPINSH